MPTATPDVEVETDTRTKQLPPYAVILHNDDSESRRTQYRVELLLF